jgi:phosphoserine phosphatase RsbU/P
MIELLRQIPLFHKLPTAALEALAAMTGRRQVGAGEMLFRQGDHGSECYAILAGELEVLIYVNAAEHRLDIYQPGQIIGEMALIDHSPRSATVRALADSDLVVLNEAAFMRLLHASPDLAMAMLRNGAARIRYTNQHMIADLERKNAELLAAYRQLQGAQADLIRLSRIEEELAVARRIQASFLPRRLPQPPGWDLAAYSRGAQAVGGDFFDCIELADGLLGLVVADVCGKGITAALFVALTRALLRAASQAPWIFQGGLIHDAESILTGALWLLNDYLCREHSDSAIFITLFYAILDLRTGALAYINAGHNPPLIVGRTAERSVETELGSLPVGIFSHERYAVMRDVIAPGEQLVAFSDGVTEAIGPADELFGDERLDALLHKQAPAGAHAMVTSVIAAIDAFSAGLPQSDDITLLVVART